MLKVWNMLLVILAFCLSLFGTFLTRSGVVNSIHSFTQSPLGPWFLGFICLVTAVLARARLLAAAAAAVEDAARVARLARGRVPLQQPAARRALPDDPLGRRVPDDLGARARRGAHDRAAVLRLLPADVRPAAAAADGHRAADRVAARVAARSLGRTFVWPAAIAVAVGLVLVALGAGSSTPGLVAYTFSAFVLATIGLEFVRGTRATGSFTRLVVAQPPALRRLHRPRGDRAARARDRRLERVRLVGRAEAVAGTVDAASAATRSRTGRSRSSASRTISQCAPRSTSIAAATSSRASSRARTTTSPRSRSRTRWRSTRTGCAPRTST